MEWENENWKQKMQNIKLKMGTQHEDTAQVAHIRGNKKGGGGRHCLG